MRVGSLVNISPFKKNNYATRIASECHVVSIDELKYFEKEREQISCNESQS